MRECIIRISKLAISYCITYIYDNITHQYNFYIQPTPIHLSFPQCLMALVFIIDLTKECSIFETYYEC